MLSKLISGDFSKGVFWNIGSFAFLGIAGIALNFIIGQYYGPVTLGIFNQVFAIYIIFSQISSLGIHLSVVKHTAEFADEKIIKNNILVAAVYLVSSISLVICLVLYLLAPIISGIMNSADLENGLAYASLSIIFFSINKVFLGYLNGSSWMRSYAFFQSLRYGLLLIFIIVLISINRSGYDVSSILLWAELSLFNFLISFFIYKKLIIFTLPKQNWLKKHLSFGAKAALGGVVTELNTRVDVLVLGFFTSDYIVGIYSFAAILAEGFFQLTTVFRINFNPLLAQNIAKGNLAELRTIRLKTVNKVYPFVVAAGVMAIAFFPVICFLFFDQDYLKGLIPFSILILGMVISFRLLVYGNILSQGGYPGRETMVTFFTVSCNFILNVVMIPTWGMEGAAVSTALATLVNALIIKFFAKSVYGVEI
ncbi:MAG: oligosaccharide flippase family protein [Bacillota bacterium]